MMWKLIGQSVIGQSHHAGNKHCEDHIVYGACHTANEEVLVCCASDGAGSALYAAAASQLVTQRAYELLQHWIAANTPVTEALLRQMVETIYDELSAEAASKNVPLDEFSCTLLGCLVFKTKAVFFQIGDGAIVRNDGSGRYTLIWWPQNGEYQNSTAFLVDDRVASQLKVQVLEETITEVAILTDGLQLLALNVETMSVHQPFFSDMFKWLRMANDAAKLGILQQKLRDYLNSPLINRRTDDDKTLFLASRLNHDRQNS